MIYNKLSASEKLDIDCATDILRKGGIILYPTDTVWGLGCDATNEKAVTKIFQIKQRPDAKALITLMSGTDMLQQYIYSIPEVAIELTELATTPITVIYDNALPPIARNLMAEDGSMAVRVPSGSNFCMALCEKFRKPIVSTSANISGSPTPRTFKEISEAIISSADYVCQTARHDDTPHKPSSIIKIHSDGRFKIIRK